MQKDKYWNLLTQSATFATYIERYRESCETIERRLAIVTALTSSAAIAGWAVWQRFGWLWACIIAFSQVLSAIRPYLPYARMAEVLRENAPRFRSLSMRVEEDWFGVNVGLFSEEEIHHKIMAFRKEHLAIEEAILAKVSLKQRPELLVRSEQDIVRHLKAS